MIYLPPLAGPLIRALYCRFSYVGRYVIAIATALERNPPPAQFPKRAASAASKDVGSPTVACDRSASDLRAQIARAATHAVCGAAVARAGADGAGTLAPSITRLLAELPLRDVIHLVVDARVACEMESTDDLSGANIAERTGVCASRVLALARERFPEAFQRLLTWRQGLAASLV